MELVRILFENCLKDLNRTYFAEGCKEIIYSTEGFEQKMCFWKLAGSALARMESGFLES